MSLLELLHGLPRDSIGRVAVPAPEALWLWLPEEHSQDPGRFTHHFHLQCTSCHWGRTTCLTNGCYVHWKNINFKE